MLNESGSGRGGDDFILFRMVAMVLFVAQMNVTQARWT